MSNIQSSPVLICTQTRQDWPLPRIGLLSDSHGRARTTQRAVDTLVAQGIDMLIHLGDVGTVDVIDALAVPAPDENGQIEAHLVYGNTDWDLRELSEYATDMDLTVDHPVGRIDLEEGQLVFCHGHEPEVMNPALADGARYLCHGHTHEAADDRRGSTRVINPGALFRAKTYSVAILDTTTDQLVFLPVPGA